MLMQTSIKLIWAHSNEEIRLPIGMQLILPIGTTMEIDGEICQITRVHYSPPKQSFVTGGYEQKLTIVVKLLAAHEVEALPGGTLCQESTQEESS